MKTITTQHREPEFRLKISTWWMKKVIRFIGELLSFEDIRMIEHSKQKELHESRLDLFKMN